MKTTPTVAPAANDEPLLKRLLPFLFDFDEGNDEDEDGTEDEADEGNEDGTEDDASDDGGDDGNDDASDDEDDDDEEVNDIEAARKALKEARKAARQAERDAAAARREAERFKGIDPKKARENAKRVRESEKAARQAEKDKATAEGNFERLREIQNEEHQAALDAVTQERDDALSELERMRTENRKEKLKSAFAGSKFFADETILSGAKAQRLYGDHAEVEEDGSVVIYDKPAGEKNRVKLMNGRGVPLPFDEAVKKLVEADPDKDTLIRSKMKPGGRTKTEDSKVSPESDRISRIAKGLASLRK